MQGRDSQMYRRLQLYQLLAWGLPVVLTMVTLAADLVSFIPDSFKPLLGRKKCWFSNETTRLIYVVVAVDVTEIVNLTLCVATLKRLYACKQSSAALRSSNVRQHNSKEVHWTGIYMKVCFVMGSAYIFVTLMGLITWNYKDLRGMPNLIVKVVKDIERLRGVEIFFIFVCKKKIMKQLYSKFCSYLTESGEEQSTSSRPFMADPTKTLETPKLHNSLTASF